MSDEMGDEEERVVMKMYGSGGRRRADEVAAVETEIKKLQAEVETLLGVKEWESLGLAEPSTWDIEADINALHREKTLIIGTVTQAIPPSPTHPEQKRHLYVLDLKSTGKRVVEAHPISGIKEPIQVGDRVAVDRGGRYQIRQLIPPRIDATIAMMQIDEKPDVAYDDIAGCDDQIRQLREVVEIPMLEPERFKSIGVDPPKGVLLHGPPGTGKTLCGRAVANATNAAFISVVCSELVQKYVGEGGRLVRDLFKLAKSKGSAIIFMEEVDAIGGTRFDDGVGGDSEVQRTMLELVNQLDGFDSSGNVKVIMATNRPDSLDPALIRPGRIDRRVEFKKPDLEGRGRILALYAQRMPVEEGVRFPLIAQMMPNATGAELRAITTEAAILAIRQGRRTVSEAHFIAALKDATKTALKFSSTNAYITHL